MWVLLLIAAAAIYFGAHDVALAQATTPNVTPPFQGLSTPITSTVTNCMMLCNSRASNCQTGCVIPAPPTTTPIGTTVTLNATSSTACVMGCTSSQLACRTTAHLEPQPFALVRLAIAALQCLRTAAETPPLPAALDRRRDGRLLHRPRRQRAGTQLRLFRWGASTTAPESRPALAPSRQKQDRFGCCRHRSERHTGCR
jgi:hypothetical protein